MVSWSSADASSSDEAAAVVADGVGVRGGVVLVAAADVAT